MITHTRMLRYGKENKCQNPKKKKNPEDSERMKFTRNKAINWGNHLLEK